MTLMLDEILPLSPETELTNALAETSLGQADDRTGETEWPLSLAQRLTVRARASGVVFDHHVCVLALQGRWEKSDILLALTLLFQRHAILRAVSTGQNSLTIASAVPVETVSFADDHASLETENKETAFVNDFSRNPFPLVDAPLARVAVVESQKNKFRILMVFNEIAVDRPSQAILLRDLQSLLAAQSTKRDIALPPITLTHRDYCDFEHRRLSPEGIARVRQTWLENFESAPLPSFANRADDLATPPGIVQDEIAEIYAPAVTDLLRAQDSAGTNIIPTLLAAFKAMLMRWSDQTDITVLVPRPFRPHPLLAPAIGFFSDFLPIRTRARAEQSIETLAAQIRDALSKSETNPDFRLGALAAFVATEKLPRIGFSFDAKIDCLPNFPEDIKTELRQSHLAMSPTLVDRRVLPEQGKRLCDLWMSVTQRNTQLVVSLDYNTSLFSPSTIKEKLDEFVCILTASLETPSASLGALWQGDISVPIATPKEIGVVLEHMQANLRIWLLDRVSSGAHASDLILQLVKQSGLTHATATRAVEEAFVAFDRPLILAKRPQPRFDGGYATIEDHKIRLVSEMGAPRILVMEHFLSPEECEGLIAIAQNQLIDATVVSPTDGGTSVAHRNRRAKIATLARGQDELVAKIERRISRLLDWPIECGETFQIIRYGVGDEYRPHFDWFDSSLPKSGDQLSAGGQRIGTLLLYLNQPRKGGGTSFPSASGLTVHASPGAAVYFDNLDENLAGDVRTLHGGEPVIEGEKWVATKWLRIAPF